MKRQKYVKMRGYIETERDLRVIAQYENRKNGIYIKELTSLQKAMKFFREFGEINSMDQYVKGKRITVWDKLIGWNQLEKRITEGKIKL